MSIEVGAVVEGTVTGITNFGAFIELPGGKVGLVHISEVADVYVRDVKDFLKERDKVQVKVLSIDANGKIVMNWIISCLIYGIVSGILCLIGIGVVLLIALAICNLTFIIIGSVKASQGNLWPYPLSIPFIK